MSLILKPRTGTLVREKDISGVSGTGIVAWVVQFPDGITVTRWCSTPTRQTCIWDSVHDLIAIHGHGGATVIQWDDEQ